MELGENQFVSIDYLSLGKQTAQKYVNKTNKQDENLKLYSTKMSYSNMENKIVGLSNVKFRYLESLILTTAESTREMMNATTKNIVANLDVVTDKFVEFNIRLKTQILENSQKTIREEQINYGRIIKTIMVNSIVGQIVSLDLFKSQEKRADAREKNILETYKVLGNLVIDQISDLKNYVSEEFDNMMEKTENITEGMLEISDQFTQLSTTYQTLMSEVGSALTNVREVVADKGVDITRLENLVLGTRNSLMGIISDMLKKTLMPVPDFIGATLAFSAQATVLMSDYTAYQAGELGAAKPVLKEFNFTLPPPPVPPARLPANNPRDKWINDHPRIVAGRIAVGQPDVPQYVEDRIKRREKAAAAAAAKASSSPPAAASSSSTAPRTTTTSLSAAAATSSPPTPPQPPQSTPQTPTTPNNSRVVAEEAILKRMKAEKARREALAELAAATARTEAAAGSAAAAAVAKTDAAAAEKAKTDAAAAEAAAAAEEAAAAATEEALRKARAAAGKKITKRNKAKG